MTSSPTMDSRHDRMQPHAGFTVVEAVVAMLLLALGLAASWGLACYMVRGNGYSGRMTEATTLAGDKLEDLFRQGYGNVVSGGDVINEYNRTWEVTAGGLSGTKNVQVTVSWDSMDGFTHQSVINTLVAKP